MKDQINLDPLIEIYLVSNTPFFLYEKFLADGQIKNLSETVPSDHLINEFIRIASSPIEEMDDLVYAYALYLSILCKNDMESLHFVDSDYGKIGFEWFPEIRSIFLSRLKSVNYFNVGPQKDEVIDNTYTDISSQDVKTLSFQII